jgi:hypothetical protein
MIFKELTALGLAIALAACVATGPQYFEYVATLPDVPRESTRLTIFRTSENTQYSGRSATVRIDGSERGNCDFAGYQTFYAPPGPHVLAVEMWDAPGRCSLAIEVLGGEEYFFEVRPRAENWVAGFLGAMIGGIAGGIGPTVGAFAIMGAESSGQACAGAFSIVEVDEDAALRKLRDLHLSR